MELQLKQLFNIMWWCFSFRVFRASTYFYYTENCGEIPILAYKRAKKITREEYNCIKPLIKAIDKDKNQLPDFKYTPPAPEFIPIDKELILKAKFDHYGETKAACDFAMREYAEDYAFKFGLFITDKEMNKKNERIQLLLDNFKKINNL